MRMYGVFCLLSFFFLPVAPCAAGELQYFSGEGEISHLQMDKYALAFSRGVVRKDVFPVSGPKEYCIRWIGASSWGGRMGHIIVNESKTEVRIEAARIALKTAESGEVMIMMSEKRVGYIKSESLAKSIVLAIDSGKVLPSQVLDGADEELVTDGESLLVEQLHDGEHRGIYIPSGLKWWRKGADGSFNFVNVIEDELAKLSQRISKE